MFTSRVVRVWLLALLVTFTIADDRTCYYPSGLVANTDASDFLPCNTANTSAVSMCCDVGNGDRCTPEGVCLSGSNGYWRDMCTDQTWQAPECIKMCLSMHSSILIWRLCAKKRQMISLLSYRNVAMGAFVARQTRPAAPRTRVQC